MNKGKARRATRKPKSQASKNGRLLYEDSQRVVIVTGFTRPSHNLKTGNMLQVFILVKSVNPFEAVKRGLDKRVCGDCEYLKSGFQARKAKDDDAVNCYVELMHGPSPVWKAYKRGCYKRVESMDIFRGRNVRFGTYGDPVKIPYPIVKAITQACAGWTGYTHQWRKEAVQRYSDFFCASTNASNRAEAIALGWKPFTVSDEKPGAGAFLCPASKQAEEKRRAYGKPLANGTFRLTCVECQACQGNASRMHDAYIPAHD